MVKISKEEVLKIIQLERLAENRFMGESLDFGNRNVFGGQVLGQSLSAATQTVEETRQVHSLHAYFLRPGDKSQTIEFDVDRIRDGRSFATRRVVASQKGEAIFSMSASFKVPEEGFEHYASLPDGIPAPESLKSDSELREELMEELPEERRQAIKRAMPFEIRPVYWPHGPNQQKKHAPENQWWFRIKDGLPDEPRLKACIWALMSDYALMGTAMLPHGVNFGTPGMQAASLDHAIWFHHEIPSEGWMLYVLDSPAAANACGFNRGHLYTREGQLVMSTAQEGLIRLRQPKE